MSAQGAAPEGFFAGTSGGARSDGNPANISHLAPDANCAAVISALRYARAFAVVLERGISTPADVEGLGSNWALGAGLWLDHLANRLPYLILTAARGKLDAPGALLASDYDALRRAVVLLSERTPGAIFWVSCASDATWQIVADTLAADMATEGRA